MNTDRVAGFLTQMRGLRTGNAVLSSKKRNLILLSVTILLCIVFTVLNPTFIRLQSLMNLVSAIAVLSIAAIGQSLVILTGGIDLSIGSSLGLAAACSVLVTNLTGNPVLGFLTVFGVTVLIGFINGLLVAKLKISVVVLTLGMMGVARSIAMVMTNNTAIKIEDPVFTFLGSGYIPTSAARIPVSLFIIIATYVVFNAVLERTVFGRQLSAIGGNEKAARKAGIQCDKATILVYVVTGLLIGLACILDVGRVKSFHPYSGVGLEFDALTAAILGGVSMQGGKLDIKGTLLGVVLLGVVISGLSLLDIYVYYVQVTKGVLLLFAVLVNRYFETND